MANFSPLFCTFCTRIFSCIPPPKPTDFDSFSVLTTSPALPSLYVQKYRKILLFFKAFRLIFLHGYAII